MKKLYSLALLLLLMLGRAVANPIDETTALRVGRAFLTTHTEHGLPASSVLVLAYRADIASTGTAAAGTAPAPAPAFYVFSTSGPTPGFVLVAGDDRVTPVLGYSDQSGFDAAHLAPQVAKWLEGYRADIRRVVELHLAASPDIAAAWQQLRSGTPGAGSRPTNTTVVAPLVATRWNQSPYYNDLCPYDTPAGGRSVSGCVATAMCQVMKFWNYPATGAGFHSYNTASYGTLSANYGTTTYQWTSMPNFVNSTNNAVATLMYQVGVSVDMNYSNHSSGAWVVAANSQGTINCAEYALKTYFGYRTTIQGIQHQNYTDAQWLALMKTELDASRPVVYDGFGSGGGHCFVADGYDANNFLHFNWGWGGQVDGYFTINALNPGSLGTGGGAGGYNSGQEAIIGIQPPANSGGGGGATNAMGLNAAVTPSATSIGYGNAFSVSTNLLNTGTAAFAGDYCAAVFDLNNALVDFVEIKTGYTLPVGYTYTNNLSFSTPGSFSILPGTYRVGVFFRATGGNWMLAADRNGFTNLPQITVTNTNTIRLNAAMTPTPATFTQGQAGAVGLNIVNAGTTTFTGQYQVNLYRLDGTFVQTINTLNETTGLPAGYYYTGTVNFSTANITAAPGTYLLALVHKPTTATSFQLSGTGNFQNPIRVNVQAAAIQADAYEPNDAVAQARALPITFSGNSATRNTVGSNCHVNSDVDYYSVALPAGNGYTITARLHDSYNSGNGQTYTLDALFSYSTNGGATWSTAYDDVMPGPFVMGNGGTLLVKVAPYFVGNTGTYLFDMSISRGAVVNATAPAALVALVSIFPNPAHNVVNVDLHALNAPVAAVRLLSLTGQVVYETTRINPAAPLSLPVEGLPSGLYLVQLDTRQGLITKKISVNP